MSVRTEVLGRVADLLVAIPLDHPTRVAIDGITGSGKTTFADEVAAAVRARGRDCTRVTMDGFHNPRSVRYRQGRESADGYYEDAYDFAALRRVLLDPLGPGGDRAFRTAALDLANDVPLDLPAVVAPPDLVVVVDGSFLQRPELDDAWDAVVFLQCDFAIARTRGAARDAALLGSVEAADRLFRIRYHAAARRYVDEVDPERAAGIVIAHDDPRRPRLERVAPDMTVTPSSAPR